MKKLSSMLAQTARDLEAFQHPRVSVAWQDTDLVYRRVYNPSPSLGQDIVGKQLDNILLNQAEAARLNAVKREVLATGETYQAVVALEFGGQVRHYDLTIEPTRDEDGEIDGLMSVNVDISDFVEAKRHLAEANERLLRILEETLDTVPER